MNMTWPWRWSWGWRITKLQLEEQRIDTSHKANDRLSLTDSLGDPLLQASRVKHDEKAPESDVQRKVLEMRDK